jgi:predicted site-specific integrase-resolvase
VLHIISTDEDPGLRIESFAVINLRGVSTNKTIIYQRVFNETNKEAFKNAIKSLSWNNILNETNDAEMAYNEFLKMFTDACIPGKFPTKEKTKH